MDVIKAIAGELNLSLSQVTKTVELIDEGNTIPFIARYRKEVTGELSDVELRELDERLKYLRNLEDRKEEVIRNIEEQGKLTDDLRKQINDAKVLQRVEDLYKPFKKKRATRASKAKEKGLEPLANILLNQVEGNLDEIVKPFIDEDKGVASKEEAVGGACDIIAEMISDNPEINGLIRNRIYDTGDINTEATDFDEKTAYEMYYDYDEAIKKIPNHRILAINRGEKEEKLKVKLVADENRIQTLVENNVIKNKTGNVTDIIKAAIEDAYKRLIRPTIQREIRNILTERAEEDAVKVFASNTEKLLMVPPVKNARIISIDPGFRTGCKVAVINDTGKLLAYTTVYPTEPRKDIPGTEKVLKNLIAKYKINTIVIGNGTASRETEEVVANFIKKEKLHIKYTIVNEAGASVYSASKLATEEYPDLDVTVRGAMSLGRRLQDPLAELVKIPIKSIGVGQYQHDINQNLLENALDNVVEDCVNRVGVNLNTASPSLLAHVAGINMNIAKNIVAYREENGVFQERKELKKVSKLGEKTFKQCAGFLRILDGKNALEASAVHPESYKIAKEVLKRIDEIDAKKSVSSLAEELQVGVPTLTDIIEEIRKPGRDPRDSAPEVIFRDDIKNFEDLKVDMELEGTVRNVVDFGAFVDIGVKNDGLVHISELSDKYVKHPMDEVSIGDTVKVRIINIDLDRQKIGLSMKSKG